MRLFPIWLPLLLVLDSTVAGLGMPAPHHLAERAVNCKVVTGVLAAVKNLGGLATSYCSSYLHIPATTTLTSITTGTPGISTSLVPVTIATTTVYGSTIYGKRRDIWHALLPRAAPRTVSLGAYAAAEISSACSCLGIKPGKTATITVGVPGSTSISTVITSITATVDPGACVAYLNNCVASQYCCTGACQHMSDGFGPYICI